MCHWEQVLRFLKAHAVLSQFPVPVEQMLALSYSSSAVPACCHAALHEFQTFGTMSSFPLKVALVMVFYDGNRK